MKKSFILKALLLSAVLFFTSIYWSFTPEGISNNGLRCGLVFLVTISALVSGIMPMGISVMLGLSVSAIMGVLSTEQALSGYSSPVIWLVVCAFFVAKGIIKTGLGQRVAYLLISKLGHSTTGLAYSILFSELTVAPMIPSATARSSGVFLPIGKALIDKYDSEVQDKSKSIGAFVVMILFFSNIITSAMFVTSMAGNPMAVEIAKGFGANITWTSWALAAVVPGMISILLLPFLLKKVCGVHDVSKETGQKVMKLARESLKEMGRITKREISVIAILSGLILAWIFEGHIHVSTTISTLFGVSAMAISGVITWDDIIEEKNAWNTFIWFGGVLSLSGAMTKSNFITWLLNYIETSVISDLSNGYKIVLAGLIIIYAHYIFASSTGYIASVLGLFIAIYVKAGVSPNAAGLALSFAAILSSGFTHYGSAVAPTLLSLGHISLTKWWKYCAITCNAILLVWVVSGALWWKLLGIY